MAHIDQFIAMMAQRKVERALLINDQAGHLWVAGQESPGPIIPRQQLQNLCRKRRRPRCARSFPKDGTVQFAHNTPHGLFSNQRRAQRRPTPSRDTPSMSMATASPTAGSSSAHRSLLLPVAAQTLATRPHAERVLPTSSYGGGGAPPTVPRVPPVVTKPAGTKKIEHIDDLFRMMKEVEASDVHLSSGEVPMIRLQGVMRKLMSMW
jgi:hypothetical protein